MPETNLAQALRELEGIKLAQKDLDTREMALKAVIMPLVQEGHKYLGTEGAFTVESRANWKFSNELNTKKESLKELEAEEIAKGIATNKPTVFIKFTVNK